MKPMLMAVALAVAIVPAARAQRPIVPDSNVAFLRPLIGQWHPANTGTPSARQPPPDYVVQAYQWTVGGMTLRLREGYRGDIADDADLDGLIYWNPATERTEFVAVAGHRPGEGRTFFGHYQRLADGSIERTYQVSYRTPADTPGEELGGRTRRYRETFRIASTDSVEATLEWWRAGRWEPFGPGRFTIVRRPRGS